MCKNLWGAVPKGEDHGNSRNGDKQRDGTPSDKKSRSYERLSLATVIEDEDTFQVREVSYEDCINYFIANEPPEFSRAAILIQKTGVLFFSSRYKIVQVYLDANDEVVKDARGRVCGRAVLADSLDRELKHALGGHNILIVE